MIYQIFTTLADAQAYADLETEALPRGPGDTTTVWDIPRQLVDGRYVVACADGDGMEWQPDWQLPEPDDVP